MRLGFLVAYAVLVSLALALAGWFVAHVYAQTAALPLDLEWQAPPECPSAEAIRSELDRIARVRPDRAASRLAARGSIEKTGERYRLSLRTERNGQVGERKLLASDCAALGREVTLVLAVAFGEGVELLPTSDGAVAAASATSDAGRAATPSTPPTPSEQPSQPLASEASVSAAPATAKTTATATPDNDTDAPTNSEAVQPSAAGLRIGAALGGGVLFGALPAPAGFAELGAELGTVRYWLQPLVRWLPRVSDTLTSDVDARYDGFGGALSACLGARASTLRLAGCLGGGAWALRGRASGTTKNESATAPWYTGELSASLTWPADELLSLRLQGHLQISLDEPKFLVEGLGQVHRVSRFAPGVSLGVVFSPSAR